MRKCDLCTVITIYTELLWAEFLRGVWNIFENMKQARPWVYIQRGDYGLNSYLKYIYTCVCTSLVLHNMNGILRFYMFAFLTSAFHLYEEFEKL